MNSRDPYSAGSELLRGFGRDSVDSWAHIEGVRDWEVNQSERTVRNDPHAWSVHGNCLHSTATLESREGLAEPLSQGPLRRLMALFRNAA